jgi:hypothetical protein
MKQINTVFVFSCFKDQGFSPFYALAPPLPLTRQQVFTLSPSFFMSPLEHSNGRGRGVGGGSKSYDPKPGPL